MPRPPPALPPPPPRVRYSTCQREQLWWISFCVQKYTGDKCNQTVTPRTGGQFGSRQQTKAWFAAHGGLLSNWDFRTETHCRGVPGERKESDECAISSWSGETNFLQTTFGNIFIYRIDCCQFFCSICCKRLLTVACTLSHLIISFPTNNKECIVSRPIITRPYQNAFACTCPLIRNRIATLSIFATSW